MLVTFSKHPLLHRPFTLQFAGSSLHSLTEANAPGQRTGYSKQKRNLVHLLSNLRQVSSRQQAQVWKQSACFQNILIPLLLHLSTHENVVSQPACSSQVSYAVYELCRGEALIFLSISSCLWRLTLRVRPRPCMQEKFITGCNGRCTCRNDCSF